MNPEQLLHLHFFDTVLDYPCVPIRVNLALMKTIGVFK